MLTEKERELVNRFHDLYHKGPERIGSIYQKTKWMDVPCFKCPLDLWVYSQIIFKNRPQVIIETGSYMGGSALFLAHMCDIIDTGAVISIDIEDHPKPEHPRITFLTGSSIDPTVIDSLRPKVSNKSAMVILDADHSETHVLKELECYSALVTSGQYLIVEDTNLNGHPTYVTHGPGPWEAVKKWLPKNNEFEIDSNCEPFLLTFNPGGFLKKN